MSCPVDHSKISGKFCTSCGARAEISSEKRCVNGHLVSSGIKFCTECGAAVNSGIIDTQSTYQSNLNSVGTPTYSPGIFVEASPVTSKVSNKKSLGILGGVLGAIVLLIIIGASVGSPTTTVQVNMTLKGEYDCSSISWGYYDVPGGAIELSMDGEIVGRGNYDSSGKYTVLGCQYTAYISEVPTDGDNYSIAFASGRRGVVYNSKSELESNAWTFDLSLG